MIQLIVPMAGLGSRFRNAGYSTPKPLIQVHGIEMYKIVLSNLYSRLLTNVVLVCPSAFDMKGRAQALSSRLRIPLEIIEVNELTEGPASTVALARDQLDMDAPLVVANSDQFVDFEVDEFYSRLLTDDCAGIILTMRDDDPKWSYAQVDSGGRVTRIVEKQVISDNATVGIYGFRRAGDFFDSYDRMVRSDFRVNGEFYVAPAYEFSEGFNSPGVQIMDLGKVGDVMYGMGVPEDLEAFLGARVSIQAAKKASDLFLEP